MTTSSASPVYISGPMRGYENYNFDAFYTAEAWLAKRFDGPIFNPARKDEEMGFKPAEDAVTKEFLQKAMRWDVEKVLQAGTIVLLPGWAASEGAKMELAVARAIGVRVAEMIYEDGEPSHLFFTSAKVLDAAITPPMPYPPPYEASVLAYHKTGFAKTTRMGRLTPVSNTAGSVVSESNPGETRVVDPKTGGEKGSKPAQLGALDPSALLDVATVAGFGATKYALFNYTKGYAWSLSYNAMQRHLLAWASGEDTDPESGITHLAHAAWHCLALITFQRFERGTDDRFPLRHAVA